MFENDIIRKAYELVLESVQNPTKSEIMEYFRIPPIVDYDKTPYAPTLNLLINCYNIFNSEFFNFKLPNNIEFHLGNSDIGEQKWAGTTKPVYDKHGKADHYLFLLNAKYKMSIKEWIATILHECFHLLDFVDNPDEYYRLFFGNGTYNPHGDWFKNQCRKFDKYGFSITEQTSMPKENLNLDDEIVRENIEKELQQMAAMIYTMMDNNKLFCFIKKSDIEPILDLWAARYNKRYTCWNDIRKLDFYNIVNPYCVDEFKIPLQELLKNEIITKPYDDCIKEYGELGSLIKTVDIDSIKNRIPVKNESIEPTRNKVNSKYAHLLNISGVIDVRENGEFLEVTLM